MPINAAAEARVRDETRCAWLFRVVGAPTVQLLWNLCSPDQPDTKTFTQSTDLLRQNYRGARNKHTLRNQFNSCRQATGETVAQYAVRLKQKLLYCQFGAFLEDALQKRTIQFLFA